MRETLGDNFVKISYLQTAEMQANNLTKSLGFVKYYYFMKKHIISPVKQY